MSEYSWVITRDFLNENDVGVCGPSDVGVCGPRDCEMSPGDIRSKGNKFRMYDDDGELYYEGYICGDYSGLEPLDDFGMPNAGCTEIRYFKGTKKITIEKEIWLPI